MSAEFEVGERVTIQSANGWRVVGDVQGVAHKESGRIEYTLDTVSSEQVDCTYEP